MKKAWDDDDNLVVGWLILEVNDGDPNRTVPHDDPKYVRALEALNVNAVQLDARVNMLRSNLPGYEGPRSGNPMNSSAALRRVVKDMTGSPTSVKMLGRLTVEKRLEK